MDVNIGIGIGQNSVSPQKISAVRSNIFTDFSAAHYSHPLLTEQGPVPGIFSRQTPLKLAICTPICTTHAMCLYQTNHTYRKSWIYIYMCIMYWNHISQLYTYVQHVYRIIHEYLSFFPYTQLFLICNYAYRYVYTIRYTKINLILYTQYDSYLSHI